jgi:hypothetical protein
MSVTPKITLVAYEDRQGAFVFVAVPTARGRYVRTDKCVTLCSCPICGSVTGEPCKFSGATEDGYGGGTHAARRQRAKVKFYGKTADDWTESITRHGFPDGCALIEPVEVPAPVVTAKLLGSIDLCEPRAIA